MFILKSSIDGMMKIRLSRKHIRKVTPHMNIKVIPCDNSYDFIKMFNFMLVTLLMQIYVSIMLNFVVYL